MIEEFENIEESCDQEMNYHSFWCSGEIRGPKEQTSDVKRISHTHAPVISRYGYKFASVCKCTCLRGESIVSKAQERATV